jgi:hypothetical protein
MTDLTLTVRKPGVLGSLVRRFRDWMSEEVGAEAPLQFSREEWADLPTHHPIRDDRGGRSGSSWRGRVVPPA